MCRKGKIILEAVLFLVVLSGNNALAQFDLSKKFEISRKNDKNQTSYSEQLSFKIPISSDQRNLIFLDARGNLDSNLKYAGNVGLALRSNINDDPLVFGIYGFYDYSLSPENYSYNQVSGGLELLSKSWEARANFYLPVGNQLNTKSNLSNVKDYESLQKVQIDSNGKLVLLSDTSVRQEAAFKGFEVEAGTKINDTIGIYAGGYYFYRDGYDKIIGPRAKITLSKIANNSEMSVSAIAQKDSTRGIQFMLGLDFVLSPKESKWKQTDLRTAMIRRENFVTTHAINIDIKRDVSMLLNGNEYKNGKLLKAGDDLAGQISDAGENSLVVLAGAEDGSDSTIEVSDGIVMKPGQALISTNKADLKFRFKTEKMSIPFEGLLDHKAAKLVATDNFPANTHLLTLDNKNTIVGISFDGSNLSAANPTDAAVIYGNDTSNTTIEYNSIEAFKKDEQKPNLVGIELKNSIENTISNNTIKLSGTDTAGVHFSADKKISGNNITNNTITAEFGVGINHSTEKAAVESNRIENNQITSSVGIRYIANNDQEENALLNRENKIIGNEINAVATGIDYNLNHSRVKNNVIENNKIVTTSNTSGEGVGIFYYTPGASAVESNRIENNQITSSIGIEYKAKNTERDDTSVNRENKIIGNQINAIAIGIDYDLNYLPVKNNAIKNNAIIVTGDNGYGIHYKAPNHSDVTDNIIQKNNITISGNESHGIAFDSPLESNDGSGIQKNIVDENNITVSGSDSSGVQYYIGPKTFAMNNIIKNNNINMSGKGSSGIFYDSDKDDTTLTSNKITNNAIIGENEESRGIYYKVRGQMKEEFINGNSIETLSEDGSNSFGIHIDANEGLDVLNNKITENIVKTKAKSSDGIFFDARGESSKLTDNLIQKNTVTTSGPGSHGITLRGKDVDSGINQIIKENTVTISGSDENEETYGIKVFEATDTQVVNNKITIDGGNGALLLKDAKRILVRDNEFQMKTEGKGIVKFTGEADVNTIAENSKNNKITGEKAGSAKVCEGDEPTDGSKIEFLGGQTSADAS